MSATESAMVGIIPIRFANLLSACLTLVTVSFLALSNGYAENPYTESESTLLNVTITTEFHGARDALPNNRQMPDKYNPILKQIFSSTGIALDRKGYIMTFLGYGRIFVQKADSRFEIDTKEGRRYDGSLVGIDQGNGAAVVHVPDGDLKSTPVCPDCDISDGTTVIAPVFIGPGGTQFQETQIISIRSSGTAQERESWVLRMNRPFLGIGKPLFTGDGRVLGFIVSQDITGLQNLVYPISELLSSAKKIIEKDGDIRTGWLGVYTDDTPASGGYGVVIDGVEEGSPAQKSGLAPEDIVLRYNNHTIKDVRQFIRLVQDTPIGSRAELEILRDEHPMTLVAVIQSLKFQDGMEYLKGNLQDAFGPIGSVLHNLGQPFRLPFGMDVINLTPTLAAEQKIQGKQGLLVVNIGRHTPAELAGIKNRDVILSVNEKPVDNAQDFNSYLRALHPGSTVSMKVVREGSVRTVSIQVPD
jgi:serine protease Do